MDTSHNFSLLFIVEIIIEIQSWSTEKNQE